MSSMADKPRKPTGEHPSIAFGPDVDGLRISSLTFPSSKEEVERFVALPFAANASVKGWFPFKLLAAPEQNPTDDFDFTLHTDRGRKYLELMEIHLRDVVQEMPSGQYSYEPYAVAQLIYERIQAKSTKYQGATSCGIVLLTYVTHWEFCLADVVYWLLAYWMRDRPPIFEQVFDVNFLDESAFESRCLYPANKDFSSFEPEKYRENTTILLNPRRWNLEVR
jgi:hypothetical protein